MQRKLSALLLLCLACSTFAILPLPIDKEKYGTNVVNPSSSTTFYFLANTTTNILEIAIECQCNGWVGWGITRSGGMTDTDVIIAWVDAGVPYCMDYNIASSRSFSCPNGVCPDTSQGGTNDVLDFNASNENGVTQVIFQRQLNTGDTLDVVIDPEVTDGYEVLLGFHSTNIGPNLQQHNTKPTPQRVNFFTGDSSSLNGVDLLLVHGALMFIVWFLAAPAGFVLARFMKGFKWWFNAHRILMTLAMILMICSFGIAIYANVTHFNTAHKIIGLIVVIIGTAQPVFGFLADKFFNPERKGAPIFPDKIHWVLGWVSIILGMINIILGIDEYETSSYGVLVAYCVAAAILFNVLLAFSIFRLVKPANNGH